MKTTEDLVVATISAFADVFKFMSEVTCPKSMWLRWKYLPRTRKLFQQEESFTALELSSSARDLVLGLLKQLLQQCKHEFLNKRNNKLEPCKNFRGMSLL